MDNGLKVQLGKNGGGSVRQSLMERSGMWPMYHLERRGISQVMSTSFSSQTSYSWQRCYRSADDTVKFVLIYTVSQKYDTVFLSITSPDIKLLATFETRLPADPANSAVDW